MLALWNPVEDAMKSIYDSLVHGFGNIMSDILTMWLSAPEPNMHDDYVMWMRDRLSYFVATGVLISVLVAAYRMAITQKWENLGELAKSIAGLLAVSAASVGLLTIAIHVTDVFSKEMIHGSFGASVLDGFSDGLSSAFGMVLAIILLQIATLINIILYVLILGRDGVIILLACILPLAASATNTKMGKQWFDKILAWLIAFVLFKPTAALIYALSFRMMTRFHGITSFLIGLCLWLFALIALPALMRLIVPATSAMSMGNPAAMIAGAVATGVMLKSGMAGGGGFGSSPSGAGGGGGGGGGTSPPPPPPPPPGGGGGSPAPGPSGSANSAASTTTVQPQSSVPGASVSGGSGGTTNFSTSGISSSAGSSAGGSSGAAKPAATGSH